MKFFILIYEIFFSGLPNLDRMRRCGLLAVKIGQIYALRSDFLPIKKTKELLKLYEKNYDTQKRTEPTNTLENANIDEDIDLTKSQLIAEASIGQAWSAKYQDQDIIIKIVKSDFLTSFSKDVIQLRKILKVITWIYPKLAKVADPIGTLADIDHMVQTELDLRNEISGQRKLKKIYSKHETFLQKNTQHSLYFHMHYPSLSNANMLVSERIDGASFNQLLDSGELPYQALLDFFFIHVFGMLQEGCFHDDIHPGNIFLCSDGRIALLDTASVAQASNRIQKGLFVMFRSLVMQDYMQAAIDLSNMSINQKDNQDNFTSFQTRFCELYADFAGKTLKQLSLTNQMMQSIKLAVHSGYEFERGMFPVIKSFMFLDGMALRCNPNTDLMQDIGPFIKVFESYSKKKYQNDSG